MGAFTWAASLVIFLKVFFMRLKYGNQNKIWNVEYKLDGMRNFEIGNMENEHENGSWAEMDNKK